MSFFNIVRDVTSWIALIAYGMALLAYMYAVPNLARLKSIEKLPPKDRAAVLSKTFGPMPENITASKWIEDRRNKYYLIAFIFTLIALVATFIIFERQDLVSKPQSDDAKKITNTTYGNNSPIINPPSEKEK